MSSGAGSWDVRGASIKKTTLNKKTDSHVSESGCRICFYSEYNQKINKKHSEGAELSKDEAFK